MSRSNSPNPGLGSVHVDPLMAAYTTKRRPSRSETGGPLPPRSVSPLPAHPNTAQSSSSASSVSSSLSSVQHAAGSWWKRASASASALYQQAAQQLADEQSAPGHKRSHSRKHSAASTDTLSAPAAADGGFYPTISSSATSPSFQSASPSSAGSSSFLSSVLSSVSAAVSNVSAGLPSTSPQPTSGGSYEASADSDVGEPEPGFVELDLLDKYFDHPDAYVPATTTPTTSSLPSDPPSAAPAEQSPLSLSVARMSLLASVLSAESGGYLSPTVFFPRASLSVPSLRLPALPQKLSTLERFDEMLEETDRRTAGGRMSKDGQLQHDEAERWQNSLIAVLAGCHKLQNELAFSLSSIKESHPSSVPSADGESETMTADDSAAAAEPASASSITGLPTDGHAAAASSSSHHSSGLTMDKLSSRVKAFGYSVAKTASRISKQVLQDKVSREQADVYASLVSRIARHMQRMQQHYSALSGGLHDDRELHARVNELAVFVCDVLVVFIADDLQRCMAVYMQQEQEALSRGHVHGHVLQLEQESRKSRGVQHKQQAGEATAAYAERAEASAATIYAEMALTTATVEPSEPSNSTTGTSSTETGTDSTETGTAT